MPDALKDFPDGTAPTLMIIYSLDSSRHRQVSSGQLDLPTFLIVNAHASTKSPGAHSTSILSGPTTSIYGVNFSSNIFNKLRALSD
jgi:hypothetical protein